MQASEPPQCEPGAHHQHQHQQQHRRRRRLVVDGAASALECKRLSWLVDALGRPAHIAHVDAVTTFELARCAPHLVPLVARARHVALTTAEAAFGREAALFVEWSGVVAWREGAEIGWHYDANRCAAARGVCLFGHLGGKLCMRSL
jgi:hypothetical protein